MNKIISRIRKHDNLIVLFIIIFSLTLFCLIKTNTSNDEMWNFANIYKMCNGYKIYNEINIIVTPFFFYIGKFILNTFGKNIFVFEIYDILIFTLYFFMIYNIFKELKINKKLSLIYILILMIIYQFAIFSGANYNILALDFVLIGVFINIKKNTNLILKILHGIVIFLIGFSKQNMIIYYLIGLLVYNIYKYKKIKEVIGNLIIPLFITFVLGILYIWYLYYNNNLSSFLNYVVFGIEDFTLNMSINYNVIGLISIIIIYICIISNKKIKEKVNELYENVLLLFCFGLPISMMCIPIANIYHILVGETILIIGIIYILNQLIIKEFISNKYQKNFLKIFYIIFISVQLIAIIWNFAISKDKYKLTYNHPYYGTTIYNEDYEYLCNITNFIQNSPKDVIIFSYYANWFNVITGNCNGKYDLPFHGNVGAGGKEKLIEDLSKLKNKYILIINQEKETLYWQEFEEANEYIMNNFTYIGEFENFLIYETEE